jgi:ferredoxin
MTSPECGDCVSSCPIKLLHDTRQATYEKMRDDFYGDEGLAAITMQAMAMTEDLDGKTGGALRSLGIELSEMRDALARQAAFIDEVQPPPIDFPAMQAACTGPRENYEGLRYGFNAVRMCGSTAISETTRRSAQQIIPRPEE